MPESRLQMSRSITVAVSQSHALSTLSQTLSALSDTARRAAQQNVDLLLFPEAYLGGYPRGCSFGTTIGDRTALGRDQYLAYTREAVDLGDTPRGAGQDWIERKLPVASERGQTYRGDGTREFVENVAQETGVFLVVGLIEKAGGSLYCSATYVDPKRGCIGKRRKVMPTATERLVWAQGQPETLRAVTTVLKGVKVTLAAAICWENYMPLLRGALYSQGVNIWCAPTADGREVWQSLIKTIGVEGRCFVLNANQCIRRKNLPEWVKNEEVSEHKKSEERRPEEQDHLNGEDLAPLIRRKSVITRTEDNHEITWPPVDKGSGQDPAEKSNLSPGFDRNPQKTTSPLQFSQTSNDNDVEATKVHHNGPNGHIFALPAPNGAKSKTPTSDDSDDQIISRGGSCIVSPSGELLAGPLWDDEDGLLVRTIDLDDCDRGHLDFDVAGSYGRLDSFELKVRDLDLNPPP